VQRGGVGRVVFISIIIMFTIMFTIVITFIVVVVVIARIVILLDADGTACRRPRPRFDAYSRWAICNCHPG
jgi:hypothetical protein